MLNRLIKVCGQTLFNFCCIVGLWVAGWMGESMGGYMSN